MFLENFFFGIGYGAFNLEKGDYGFNIRVLIDAHNGYLNTLAQMGISSIPFLYFIYLYPYVKYKGIREHSYLKLLFVINITMAIADLSNAGIYKYSVFAMLAFNSIVLMTLSRASKANSGNDSTKEPAEGSQALS
jgi:O-antigen ligase